MNHKKIIFDSLKTRALYIFFHAAIMLTFAYFIPELQPVASILILLFVVYNIFSSISFIKKVNSLV